MGQERLLANLGRRCRDLLNIAAVLIDKTAESGRAGHLATRADVPSVGTTTMALCRGWHPGYSKGLTNRNCGGDHKRCRAESSLLSHSAGPIPET
jgi:hypothetical protein